MKDLIKALQIFLKYNPPTYPTICEHDELYVLVDPTIVSKEDLATLEDLGFRPAPEHDCFRSTVFGSA